MGCKRTQRGKVHKEASGKQETGAVQSPRGSGGEGTGPLWMVGPGEGRAWDKATEACEPANGKREPGNGKREPGLEERPERLNDCSDTPGGRGGTLRVADAP